MEIWKAIIVGIVQGLAEFLPISSSGHIVLTQYLLGIREMGAEHQPDLGFEVILHVGTLVSVLLFFRRSLWRLVQSLFDKEMIEERKKIMWLGVATVPAVIAALLFKDFFDAVPGKPVVVSGLLYVTGLILFIPRLVKGGAEKVGLKTSVIMGIGQAFAILPGISRSGSTIAAGMVSGAKAEKAAEFSFLMSIPAITGGFVLTMKDRIEQTGSFSEALKSCFSAPYLAGAITSALVGLLAIYSGHGGGRSGQTGVFFLLLLCGSYGRGAVFLAGRLVIFCARLARAHSYWNVRFGLPSQHFGRVVAALLCCRRSVGTPMAGMRMQLADGFDFPVGKPDAAGYYKARGMRLRPPVHFGEDWNGRGGGDSDLGDPIYAVADGVVMFAYDCRGGWGRCVLLRHAYRDPQRWKDQIH